MTKIIDLPEGVIASVGEYVDPTTLKAAGFNPQARTYERQLRKLKRAIEETGNRILNPLHVYGGPSLDETNEHSNELLDGHRRRAVALELCIAKVPVTVYYGDYEAVKKLFVTLNDSQLKLNKQQQMEVIYYGGPQFPDVIDQYVEIEDLLGCGSYEFERFIDKKMAPFVLGLARSVAKYCNIKQDQAQFKGFLRQTLIWMMDRGQQQQAKQFMRQFSVARNTKDDFHIKKLTSAIKNDKALEW